MATYSLVHSPAWNTVKASQVGDGTAGFWVDTFIPLWERFCNVARYLREGGTIPTTGPSLDSQGASLGDPDGTTLLGWSGYGPTPQSTVRALLEILIDQIGAKVALNGADAMTGALRAPEFIVTDGSNTVTLLPRAPWRSDGIPMPVAGQWSYTTNGDVSADATGAILPIQIFPPHGSTLGSVSVTIKGAAGHVGLPGGMPTVQVWYVPLATGVPAPLGSATLDPSATVGAYQAAHSVVATGAAHVVDRDANKYMVVVTNESGANSLTGALYMGARRVQTVSKIDEA